MDQMHATENHDTFFDIDAAFDAICLLFLACLFGGALLKALAM